MLKACCSPERTRDSQRVCRDRRAWDRLATDLDTAKLETIEEEIALSGVVGKAADLMGGQGPRTHRGQNLSR